MKRISVILILMTVLLPAIAQNELQDSIDARQLDEVVVNGEMPRIKAEDGIMVVDLPSIVKDKPVSNILEALGFLPGVVNNNGVIGLNGASDVTIIINGEPTAMPLQNLYQLLYSTPIDRLKNVEIMYSAPAKYHVNGSVINIVMKTPNPLDGLTGQTTFGYNQAHYTTLSGGINTTYAIKEWTFDFNWTLSNNKTYNRQETFSNHLVNGIRAVIEDDMRQIGQNWNNFIHASASYKKIRLSYNGQFTSDIRNRSLSAGTFGTYSNLYRGLSPTSYHNISVRYSSPFGLTAGGDYTSYYERRCQNLFREDDVNLVSAENRQSIKRYHVYIDQEHLISNWAIGYGADYQHSDDKSRQTYILPPKQGFDDTLSEDVVGPYISAQSSFQWGLSFNASLKAEYFHNQFRHNWNLIPQFGATFYKTPNSIFQLNLTSIRVYPSFWELHGGTSYVNDYTTILGNPALQPYMNYTGQFSYIFRQKYAATFYMLYADNYSVQLPYQSANDLQLVFQTLNMDFSKTIGLQLHLPFDVKNLWNATGTINILHAQHKSSNFHDLSFKNKRWGLYAALNNTFRISQSSPVSLSIDGTYIAGQIQGPGRFAPLWKIDAGVKWRFGKKRCCELDIKANDIFNTCNPNLRINFAGQDYQMKSHYMNRNLKLTFIYRFNGFKPKEDSDIDTSRFGTGR